MSETFKAAFNGVIGKSLSSTEEKSGDFYKDDILHCGVCGQPKRKMLQCLGTTREVGIQCDCEKRKRAKRDEALRRARIQRLRCEAFGAFNHRALEMRFDKSTINTKAIQAARKYSDDLEKRYKSGKGIVFAGDKGTGKTYAATCILNAALDAGYSCKATSYSALEKEMRSAYANANTILEKLAGENQFVMLDDLGTERDTPSMKSAVYDITDFLYKAEVPLIITTNLTLEEMSVRDNDAGRIYDRIFENSDIVICNGDSLRI